MAKAGRVAILYNEVQRNMAQARYTPIVVSYSVFQSLDETLASMEPMVREIDQSNREIIQLLENLIGHLSDFRSEVTRIKPHYLGALKNINEELNRFLRDYVYSCLSKIDDEVEEDDLTKNKLRELLTRLIGMVINERHRAAKSTKFVFKIIDLTLDALHRQLAGGELVYTSRHLALLKKVKVLVRLHRGQHGIDIPELLKELERQLRRLLPEELRQPLDLQIQELLENYDTEREKRDKEKQNNALLVVIIVIAGVMFSYIKKWKVEEWKVILSFIVPILIIVVMAYIWYSHLWITRKTPELFNHVFLSCRSDILETHANPLNRALKNIQLRTFYYVERENLGRRIEEKLQEGVKHSASAIIIFSKEFATSNWCLYELVLILERCRTSFYPIIPIYCDGVNYRDLTFQNGSIYHDSLENHKTIYGEKKVNEWKAALQDVGGHEAWIATGSESELTTFFEQVAKDIKVQITPFVRVP